MLMYLMFYGFREFTQWVSRYDTQSTFFIATGRVANRHNRLAILSHRALPFTIKNALCMPFNCGF